MFRSIDDPGSPGRTARAWRSGSSRTSRPFPLNEPVPGGTGLAPDVINWAPRDYGNRVGIFRMMEVMARHGVRGTVALNAEVCDDYPQIIEDARALGWEFMGHNQSNARLLHLMAPDDSGGSCSRRFPASK